MNKLPRILGFLLLFPLVGCQGDNRPGLWDGDNKAVSDLLSDWGDVDKNDTTAVNYLFAKGSELTVAQIKNYKDFNIMPGGLPSVSSTTATYPVLVYNRKKPGDPAKLDWTFEKEGEVWKIKTAPLP